MVWCSLAKLQELNRPKCKNNSGNGKPKNERTRLEKGKEQDAWNDEDGIMLVKVQTSAACCDDLQQMRNPLPIPFKTINDYFIGLCPPNTATSNFTTVMRLDSFGHRIIVCKESV